jgi:hypothetical protein
VAVPARAAAYSSGSASIDGLERFFRTTLQANRKEFQGSFTRVQGFRAGAGYPQVWVRDSATILPLSRWLYPRGYLSSWLEEHLAHQQPDGSLFDWIAQGEASQFNKWAPGARDLFHSGTLAISGDKNTTEADQETSAVDAAYQVYRATGDANWLKKPIRGSSVIERCAAALRFVLEHRYDTRLGLATSAFTADWGDVSAAWGDQRAIYLDANTPLVAGLYTNALLCRAMSQLAQMYEALGNEARTGEWRAQAELTKRNLNRHFWQPELGFYRMHIVLVRGRLPASAQDDGLFALGGNTLAVLAGVASEEQARRIFDVAETRRRRYQLTSVAGVLLPPFPEGVFLHPALATPWQYQNGGQWDWFAGRFVLAEFERGFSRRATEHLEQLARRVVAAGGCYEWFTREGAPRGSARYSGSASALALALYEGLFGVELAGGVLDLDVRLRGRSGSVALEQPATGATLSYRYRAEPLKLSLDVQTSARPGRLRIALPEGARALDVRRRGAKLAFRTETRGEDRYVVIPGMTIHDALEVHVARRP